MVVPPVRRVQPRLPPLRPFSTGGSGGGGATPAGRPAPGRPSPAPGTPPSGDPVGEAEAVKQLSYAAMLLGVLVAVLPLEGLFARRGHSPRVLARPRRLAATLVLAGAPFLAWDLYATARGHWDFDAAQTLPPRVGGLPLEEVAFFVVIPLAVVFAFEAVRAATNWEGGEPDP